MKKTLTQRLKPLLKTVLVFTMIFSLVFGQAHDAFAAGRSGGRMGGGSFRRSAPSRSYRAPSSGGYRGSYGGYGGGGYGRGGGGFFFFPSPWLFLGGGGGSLFMLLILAAVGSYLFQAFQQASDGQTAAGSGNQSVSVTKLQVGLLADARSLQQELNKIALKANTGNSAGLAKLLQESTLSLLRHPEYWVYGGSQTKQARLESAEAEFNRMILMERSKVAGETLSNIAGELKQKDSASLAVATPEELAQRDPGAYIVVTLVVGTEGKLNLPKIDGDDDLRTSLNVLGAVSSDKLLAVEVLWTPQADGDVLTRDEMVSDYPSLKLV